MSDDGFIVNWLPEAENLLFKRDRYTRRVIQDEFARNPRQSAIEFDKETHCFATPVANNRFTVVWELGKKQERDVATVRAVVPIRIVGDDTDRIKNQLDEIIELEFERNIRVA